MSNTPSYDVGDVVYLRESAALGFIEPVRISSIMTHSDRWVYTIWFGTRQPVVPHHFGDRNHLVGGSTVFFTEDEFVPLCDALDLAETNAQKQLDNIRAQKANLCGAEPTSS